jgi:NNP family nitrate/nitrite transporter-like MFS transporter
MFPGFLETTFGLSVTVAGVLGSSFALMNVVTRPGGGWLADAFGPRRTLALMVAGGAAGYWGMSTIGGDWPIGAAVVLALACSAFLQAGNGACFAMVPLIRRDLTGRMAGLAGAYGNVGAVFFLTALSLVEPQNFFRLLGGFALGVLLSLLFLKSFSKRHPSYS